MTVSPSPPIEETWNLEDLFPTVESFQSARIDLEAEVAGLDRWRGRLTETPALLADALEAISAAWRRLARLRCYASLGSDVDIRVASRQTLKQQVELLSTALDAQTAYVRPELLAAPPQLLDDVLDAEPRLAPHAFFIRDLVRLRPHVLGPAEERLLASAGMMAASPTSLYQVLNNVDLPRPEVRLSDGSRVRLTPVEFHRRRTRRDREDRRRIFEGFYSAYEDFKDTLAHNLFAALKCHVFQARARGYPSCLAAALSHNNVPEVVYHRLIEQVHERLPLLHRYFRLRQRALNLDALEYHDLHGPLQASPSRRFETAAAKAAVLRAVLPLGPEYGDALARGFESRWIDWHPAPGKRSGAYATGWAYDVHPYVLINFKGEFENVSTLAHEMGHAMHSYFSNRHQPFASAGYSIFVAEVASTLNEALLARDMIERAADADERMFLVCRQLDGLRGTLFRQVLFAEFELALHRRTEAGDPVMAGELCSEYLELVRRYHGHDDGVVRVDERYGVEWAAVPHFYYEFYVYQYATGIVAAMALCEQILAHGQHAAGEYLDFLRAGGSAYPLELLQRTGVDLLERAPYEAAFAAMERLLDELEELIATRQPS